MNDIIRPPRPKEPQLAPATPARLPKPQASAAAPTAPLPSAPQRKFLRGRSRWLKWTLLGMGVLLLLLLAIAGAGYFWYQQALGPRSSEETNITIDIPQGATIEQIADLLADKGVVQNAWATQLYMRLRGDANIKAGHYMLSPHQSVADIVAWLSAGRTDTLRVTILPGRTLAKLKGDLQKAGFDAAAIDAAFAKRYDHPLLKDKPAEVNLEGYIFPETYFMSSDATVEAVLLRSFDEFEKRLTEANVPARLAERGFTVHQGITLASVVNAEVSNTEDHRKVAQVFEKRLRIGMPLGSDVTYIYAAKQLGVTPTPALDSPYNTRKVLGLPPGAIQNFNFEALEAVVNPASTDYLFFVAGDDGTTHYGYTIEEHESNVAKYCQKGCSSN